MTHENSCNINHLAIRIRNRYRLRKRTGPRFFRVLLRFRLLAQVSIMPVAIVVGLLDQFPRFSRFVVVQVAFTQIIVIYFTREIFLYLGV